VLEPDPASLGERLAHALANLPQLTAAARKTAVWVRANHRWDAAAAAIERLACAYVPAHVPAHVPLAEGCPTTAP
jgi:hypothetical protein